MSFPSAIPAVFGMLLGVVVLQWHGRAHAQTVKECIFAAERGQVARDQGELEQARTYFKTCASDNCPELIRNDCSGWIQALPVEPSVVNLSVTASDGRPGLEITVVVDGDKTEDSQLALTPGQHSVKVSAPGYQTYQRVLDVAAGQTVTLDVTLVKLQEPRADPPPIVQDDGAGVPTAAWILGGVAVAGGASFAVFGLEARRQISDYEQTCKPDCSDEQRASVDRKQVIANVSLGVGIGALLGAVWVAWNASEATGQRAQEFSKRPKVSARSGLALQLRSEVRTDGAGLSVTGLF